MKKPPLTSNAATMYIIDAFFPNSTRAMVYELHALIDDIKHQLRYSPLPVNITALMFALFNEDSTAYGQTTMNAHIHIRDLQTHKPEYIERFKALKFEHDLCS